jgi:O-antigen/teichoic acid export membrane protein
MRKKFAGNLLLLIFANVLVKPFWIFGIDRVVQNRIGLAEYGTYLALFNFSFLFGIVLDFGLSNFNNRAVARHPSRLASYLPNLMVLKLGLSLLYFLIAFISAGLTGYSALQIKMLAFLAVNQVILSYILYLRSNLTALHLFKIDSVISVLDRFLAIIFCGYFLYMPYFAHSDFNINYFIFSQTAALFITAIVAFIALRGRQAPHPRPLSEGEGSNSRFVFWRWRFVKAILYKSAPFAMLGLLMTIYYRIDAIMLERMYSAKETGIYAQSYRLLDAINQFGYLFGVPLMPLFASMIRRRENVHDLLSFSAVLMFLFSVSAAILCVFFGDEIMRLLYHNTTPYSTRIFSLLMISFIPISSVYIFGTLLTAQGSMKILNIIAVGGILVNVILNLALIPGYGAYGTTVATIFTQTVVALLHIYVANVTFRIKWEWSLLLRLAGFVVLGAGASWLLSMVHIFWMGKLILNAGVLVLLILLLQLLPFSMFKMLKAYQNNKAT